MKNTSVSTIIWPRVHNGWQVAGHTESPDLKPHCKTGDGRRNLQTTGKDFPFCFSHNNVLREAGHGMVVHAFSSSAGGQKQADSELKVSFIYSQDYRETRLKEQTKIMVTVYRCLKLTSYVCFGFLLYWDEILLCCLGWSQSPGLLRSYFSLPRS